MTYKCPHAYRANGKNTVFCGKLDIAPYCGHQYFCPNTQRWENTEDARNCPLAQKSTAEPPDIDAATKEKNEKAKAPKTARTVTLAKNVKGASLEEMKK